MAIIQRSPLYVAFAWRRDRNLFWPTQNRTWTQSGPLYFPVAAAADFIPPTYDYPLPPRPFEHYQIPERQIGLSVNLLVAPLVQTPTAWPRQLALAFRPDLSWTARNIALLTPAAAVAEFIPPQYLYPPPPELTWPMSARTWIQRGVLVVPTNPFAQEDWPIPQRPPIAYARAVSAFIPLLHSVQPPERQDQWPIPIQPYRVYAQSAAPPTALVGAQPFAQEDWPQPKRWPQRFYSPDNFILPPALTAQPFAQE